MIVIRLIHAFLSLVLIREFAAANVKEFKGFGLTRVWNPLESATS